MSIILGIFYLYKNIYIYIRIIRIYNTFIQKKNLAISFLNAKFH